MTVLDEMLRSHKLGCRSRKGTGKPCNCGRDKAEEELKSLRAQQAQSERSAASWFEVATVNVESIKRLEAELKDHRAPIQPRGEVERHSDGRRAYGVIGEPQIEIAAWCPDEFAKEPPEQVHFLLHWPVGVEMPPIAVSWKSPDTLGFTIEELIKYRRTVWPSSKKVEGER